MTRPFSEIVDQHRTDRRSKLLSIAADVIAERGLHQTTMDQVAERAGASKIVLYRYFGSREKLVHAVLEDLVDRLLVADQEEADWWSDRLEFTLRIARANASAMRLLVRAAAHDPIYGEHFERLSKALTARTEERQLAILGESGTPLVGGRMLAEAITAFLLDAYVRWIDEGEESRDQEFLTWSALSVRAMSYYWRGLPPPASDKPSKATGRRKR